MKRELLAILAVGLLAAVLSPGFKSAYAESALQPVMQDWVFIHDFFVVGGVPVSSTAFVIDSAGNFITSGTTTDDITWHGWGVSIDRVLITPA